MIKKTIKKYEIYNKSSEDMKEIKDNSVDLIISGPPYNIGTKYNNFKDLYSKQKFIKIMKNIYAECFRVLTKKGVLIIESSDTSFSKKEYIALSGLFQDICIKQGFSLKARHINFIASKNGIETLEHDWNKDYSTKQNNHSNCHQWMVFTKNKSKFNPNEGKIFYSNYHENRGLHPCPFPKGHLVLLDMYFKKGMKVLDPFMGTANLGVEVLKRKGQFFGYEIVEKFYKEAERNLKKVK